ncbi:GIY-YIG nuclease family protein [Winogradskyella psychrotolerans]|uniref:GIY-YIG nuclease family protein n=1 Tax=Winogradskyella psychrotolerans TaxID=1344585 RepID=UPI001C07DCD2|nr:hypothetical protein [Winogradskyella psychrotolerans]MBU2928336.1 hypothetical protein [Winogradskyella psychrotolerans]
MNRRTKFNTSEYNQLRKLIKEKVLADKIEQKKIRNKIRSIGFHFSMFSSKKGYNLNDFEQLINSGQISIVDNGFENQKKESRNTKIRPKLNSTKFEKNLSSDPFKNGIFTQIEKLDKNKLDETGIYCFRLKANSKLPEKYQRILDNKQNRIIYIGKAEGQSLASRLSQEFYHTSPGTFFRSIGAVLNFQPIAGHLIGKSNQKNYKFSKPNTELIISWLVNNVEICVFNCSNDFTIEKELIKKYKPILNHTHNPEKCQELVNDRRKCRMIATNE